MDPFWGITLSVLSIAGFWKRESRLSKEKRAEKESQKQKVEKAKQDVVLAKFAALMGEPITKEEAEADRALKEAQKQRDKDIAELRKQGFTDELIATIIPTINNGQ